MWKISKDSGRYEEQSRLVKQMIKNAKRKLERRLVDRLGGNNRPFYSYVRSKTKNIVGVGPLKDRTGQLVRGNKEKATIQKCFHSFEGWATRGPGNGSEEKVGGRHNAHQESEGPNRGPKT